MKKTTKQKLVVIDKILKSKSGFNLCLPRAQTEPLDPSTLDSDESGIFCRVQKKQKQAILSAQAVKILKRSFVVKSGFVGLQCDGVFYPVQLAVAKSAAIKKVEKKPTRKPVNKSVKKVVEKKTNKKK